MKTCLLICTGGWRHTSFEWHKNSGENCERGFPDSDFVPLPGKWNEWSRNPKCTTYGIWDGKSVDKENHLCVLGHISYPLLTTLLSKWAPIYARVLSSLDERHFQNQFYYHHFYANCIYTNSLQYFVKEMGSSRTKISSHKNEQKVLFFFFKVSFCI